MIKVNPVEQSPLVFTVVSAEGQYPKELLSLLDGSGSVDFNQVISLEDSVDLPSIAPEVLLILSPLSDEELRVVCKYADVYDSAAISAIADYIGSELLSTLSDELKIQFLLLLENYKNTGFLTTAQYAESKWGTSENALQSGCAPYSGKVAFTTFDACPVALLRALSAKHPSSLFTVKFTSETSEICGKLEIQRGEVLNSAIAPSPSNRTQAEVELWFQYSRQVIVEHLLTNEDDDSELEEDDLEEFDNYHGSEDSDVGEILDDIRKICAQLKA